MFGREIDCWIGLDFGWVVLINFDLIRYSGAILLLTPYVWYDGCMGLDSIHIC